MAIGEIMAREIGEIPDVLSNLTIAFNSNSDAQSLLEDHQFTSVIIVARGTSDNAAHFLKFLIETKLGLPCGLASPSAATMYASSFRYEKTLVIAISQSGRSSDLNTFATSAKSGGAYLLSITNDAQSPLAENSDLHLPILAGEELAVPATKSFVGQLMNSYLLVMSWAKQQAASDEIIRNSKACVTNEKFKEFAAQIDIRKPLYVLGRGFSYPNAKEFALKLQETCLIPVQGMSSSDFLHGPVASINHDSQVIFMSPEGAPGESFGEAPSRIRSITGKIMWIGNGALAEKNDEVLTSPSSTSEISASITDAILFQKITHYLAVSHGFDPDSPKGLSKITSTK